MVSVDRPYITFLPILDFKNGFRRMNNSLSYLIKSGDLCYAAKNIDSGFFVRILLFFGISPILCRTLLISVDPG